MSSACLHVCVQVICVCVIHIYREKHVKLFSQETQALNSTLLKIVGAQSKVIGK